MVRDYEYVNSELGVSFGIVGVMKMTLKLL